MKESIQSIIDSATKFIGLAKRGIYKEELKAIGLTVDLTYSFMQSVRYEDLHITISEISGTSITTHKPLEMNIKYFKNIAKDLKKKVNEFEKLIPALASAKRAEKLAQLEKEKEALELEIQNELNHVENEIGAN